MSQGGGGQNDSGHASVRLRSHSTNWNVAGYNMVPGRSVSGAEELIRSGKVEKRSCAGLQLAFRARSDL
jgi:hypothetical protein